jgi:hypothetical protein
MQFHLTTLTQLVLLVQITNASHIGHMAITLEVCLHSVQPSI